ncbi:MAG: septal ring lytic transglycosylase RlpA family protein [Hyphomicrobiales bacterium]|nr:septal ring lytic transglycosylase RlpA family protein [Hyphomicrobiales bacterium]
MFSDSFDVRSGAKLAAMAAVVVTLAGCAQRPQHFAGGSDIDPRYGVKASPRVVADGQPVPKGGGQYMVGKPYVIAGKTYYPSERRTAQVGIASWYGADFHGRKTANGEIFDRQSITAAHPTMPLPSYARVTNLRNQHSIVVRVNDRGPYHGGRVMDVSQRVADALEFRRFGTAHVRVEYLGRAPLKGSDDRMLMASLRTDGSPATLDGMPSGQPVLVADREPEKPRVAALRPTPQPESQSDVQEADETETTQARPTLAAAPLPPARPFDLGTIPGAATPIAAAHKTRTAASYYAPTKIASEKSERAAMTALVRAASTKGRGFVADR